ncbi:hypothetical protein V1477_017641 [Vespula maculifrons]|uniref:Uncharacterized protein n=1 Tax=Vespula maculifrons TaxID=7453 RepID=A0ABD2B6M8_VESMC
MLPTESPFIRLLLAQVSSQEQKGEEALERKRGADKNWHRLRGFHAGNRKTLLMAIAMIPAASSTVGRVYRRSTKKNAQIPKISLNMDESH